jgi:hypothetical protein
MRLHNRALLGVFRPSDEAEVQALVRSFDEIGAVNRRRFYRDRKSRPEIFSQVMFDSDLEKIVAGADVYRGIPMNLREDCLRHLLQLLEDSETGVELHVVKSRSRLLRLCREGPDGAAGTRFDAVAVVDDRFAFRRNYRGDLEYGHAPDFVQMNTKVLDELAANGTCGKRAIGEMLGRAGHLHGDLVSVQEE